MKVVYICTKIMLQTIYNILMLSTTLSVIVHVHHSRYIYCLEVVKEQAVTVACLTGEV